MQIANPVLAAAAVLRARLLLAPARELVPPSLALNPSPKPIFAAAACDFTSFYNRSQTQLGLRVAKQAMVSEWLKANASHTLKGSTCGN